MYLKILNISIIVTVLLENTVTFIVTIIFATTISCTILFILGILEFT